MMNKYDLTDLTFLIPTRIDSIIRLENLLTVIRYIKRYFNTHIMVLEAASFDNRIVRRMLRNKVEYYFVKDEDPIFYRTHYLNLMTQKVKTDFLAIWDADVIIPPEQVVDSVNKLRSFNYDIAYPYGGIFLDVSMIIRGLYLETGKMSCLLKNKGKMKLPYGMNMGGGAILVNTTKYKEAGMENENFYGWGPEDWERFERWSNLDYRMYRSAGCLFHLTHPRDINGRHNSERQKKNAYYELRVIKNSSAEEIRDRFLERNFVNHDLDF